MTLRIYPPIGIARIGNDLTQFYVGPELPGHRGFDVNGQGTEVALTQFKVDDDQIKRQAARFRLFDAPNDNSAPTPYKLPAGARIEWTVHLVNKKAAVQRGSVPAVVPTRPQLVANPAPLLIDPGSRTVSGANAPASKFDTGEYQNRRVALGELRTDGAQHLLVLGGFGFSSSPNNASLTGFYTNVGWHDDLSDGPVTARVRLADGTVINDIAPAWVIVAPPDFAPEIQGVVTLYDELLDIAIERLGVPRPAQVSFTNHVFPLLHRTRRLNWVNEDATWTSISEDWPALANSSAAAAPLRSANADFVREIESILSRYKLTRLQNFILDEWVAGRFQSDWAGLPQPANVVSADGLTRAALDGTVGQGFYPGIEGGIFLTEHALYALPFGFRLNHAQVTPGDLTALMALPWQADFVDCDGGWWPTQRPERVLPTANSSSRVNWDRGAASYATMVNNFSRLGFITAQRDSQGNVVFAEDQRAIGAIA
jgi:hypothetical protein